MKIVFFPCRPYLLKIVLDERSDYFWVVSPSIKIRPPFIEFRCPYLVTAPRNFVTALARPFLGFHRKNDWGIHCWNKEAAQHFQWLVDAYFSSYAKPNNQDDVDDIPF